jgi:hypothetical protein
VQSILTAFRSVMGLNTNMHKSQLFMIQTQDMQTDHLATIFQGTIGQLPANYLGLPLHIGRTRRADEQALIDKIGACLPGSKGRLLTRAGRLALINAVLTSMSVYHMTFFPLTKWAIKRIDRIRRNFLWKGSDDPRRGNCPVNWARVCRAKQLGAWASRKWLIST